MKNIIFSLILITLIVAFATAREDNKRKPEQQEKRPGNHQEQQPIGNHENRPERQQEEDDLPKISPAMIESKRHHQQWTGEHWNQNPWNGHYFPTIPNNLNQNWQFPQHFRPHNPSIPTNFNPWYQPYPNHERPPFHSYNFADKYAYEYFQKNGYTARSALVFCTNPHINYIINYSRSLKQFCRKIRKNYGGGDVPTYPKTPQESL
uniref:Uncharacterized protein n=1 Tax=Strongyloides stercoralis TaxID=6248 RepID=A0A0K0E609_STRER